MTLTLTLDCTAQQLVDIAHALNGPPSQPPVTTPVPGAIDYFPADPGKAPFPSPENSTSTILNEAISGAPFLRSEQGAVWQWSKDATGKPIKVTSQYSTGYQISINGAVMANTAVQMMMVRQGQIYFQADTIWSVLEQLDSPISGIAHTTPPPPWTTSGTGAGGVVVALPAMPASPPVSNPPPGVSGRKIAFGPSFPFKTPQEAHDDAGTASGDTIVYSGPTGVAENFTLVLTKALAVDFGGRATNAGQENATYSAGLILDLSAVDSGTLPHQLAAIVPMTDCIIRGLQCTGAGMLEETHGGTATVRMGAIGNLVVDHCFLTKNQNGIGPSGFAHTIVVTNSILLDNGLGVNDGGSHNVYASYFCVSATFGPGVTSIVSPGKNMDFANKVIGQGGGHPIKSRAKVTTLLEPFFLYGADSSSLDIPDGSTQIVNIGSGTIAKKAGDANHTAIGYGVESQLNGLAGMKMSGTILDLQCDSPLLTSLGPVALSAVTYPHAKPNFDASGIVTGV